MPSRPRREVIDESQTGAYHIFTRCVRRSYLNGLDPQTGINFSHRKHWIDERVEALAGVFAIDVIDQTILDNHLHLILRNRPEIVAAMSDEEVASRWLRLHRQMLALRDPPKPKHIKEFLKEKKKLADARKRLSSISWFMAYLKEPVSRMANYEDGASGAFWSARFGSVRLEDDPALLACSLYVNMNPIRAGIAKKPEDAEFTSACERILDRTSGDANRPRSGWLSAVHVDGDGYAGAAARRRASDLGYLWVTFEQYLELLDGLIRRHHEERAGRVLEEYPPILERLGIERQVWETVLRATNRRFARDLEQAQALTAEMRDRRK